MNCVCDGLNDKQVLHCGFRQEFPPISVLAFSVFWFYFFFKNIVLKTPKLLSNALHISISGPQYRTCKQLSNNALNLRLSHLSSSLYFSLYISLSCCVALKFDWCCRKLILLFSCSMCALGAHVILIWFPIPCTQKPMLRWLYKTSQWYSRSDQLSIKAAAVDWLSITSRYQFRSIFFIYFILNYFNMSIHSWILLEVSIACIVIHCDCNYHR